jgi:DMSO/TMAO reductase YedYZ heme-binding membrane subunit
MDAATARARRRAPALLEGWSLVGWCSLALVLGLAALLAATGTDEAGVRAGVRATARSSVLIFRRACAAASLARLWRSPARAWLLRNRRQIGVSFAVSHALHGAFLIWFALGWPDTFRDTVSTSTLVFGSLGYVFVAAMTATSFDRSAAWLGRRRWKLLHTTGIWILWGIFFATFVPAALRLPSRIPFALALVAALFLRIAANLRDGPRKLTRNRPES